MNYIIRTYARPLAPVSYHLSQAETTASITASFLSCKSGATRSTTTKACSPNADTLVNRPLSLASHMLKRLHLVSSLKAQHVQWQSVTRRINETPIASRCPEGELFTITVVLGSKQFGDPRIRKVAQ